MEKVWDGYDNTVIRRNKNNDIIIPIITIHIFYNNLNSYVNVQFKIYFSSDFNSDKIANKLSISM